MAPARKKQRLSEGSDANAEPTNGSIQLENTETATTKPEHQRRSLFVRSLPASTTSESLTALFSDSYPVKHATAVIDKATKECKGYGFVTLADAEDAQRARNEFNGKTLEGRKLRVEVAEPRQRDAEKAAKAGDDVVTKKKEHEIVQPSRLIVRNLPWTMRSSDDLAKLFMSFGKVKQAYIPKKRNGLLAGFGFVVLRGRKNAEKALEGVNGKEVEGRSLAVDWAVSKDVYEDLLSKGKEGELDEPGTDVELGVDGMDVDGDVDANEEGDETADVDDSDGMDVNAKDDLDADNDEVGTPQTDRPDERSTTLFIRNLPFTCTDEDLEDHFSAFGATRYARVVMDPTTERSRGTGFVCFYNKEDADTCVRAAPRRTLPPAASDVKDNKASQHTNSILQNEDADPSGKYTMDGRVLQVSQAVDKSSAERLTQEGAAHRRKKTEDKRRLYLLSEGTISSTSKLYAELSPTERNMREASAKQRKSLIESNPSLHLSLTRLSIRNIPRSVDSKLLKALAREAVVGFATDVKSGKRQTLSKEERARGGDDMQAAEHARKKSGKGVVKQAKVVFEGAGGSKVSEGSGAGQSRGYGFIEYHTHRSALMGLRWLNGHAVGYQVKDNAKTKVASEEMQDRKKRLIVEFAIENAQVVMRRKDSEAKARNHSLAVQRGEVDPVAKEISAPKDGAERRIQSRKRKREPDSKSTSGSDKKRPRSTKNEKPGSDGSRSRTGVTRGSKTGSETATTTPRQKKTVDEKLAQRNRIIGRKRMARKERKR